MLMTAAYICKYLKNGSIRNSPVSCLAWVYALVHRQDTGVSEIKSPKFA